jgi:electron transport complex protein RnfD
VLIRFYGGYPEGVSYAILLMNLLVPVIDRYVRPAVYGKKKKARAAAA